MSDLELWKALKNGDQSALKAIYSAHAPALLRYGKRFSPSSDLLQDCVHDLFVYIWTNRAKLSDTDAIGPYLTVAMRRRIINALKSAAKISKKESDLEAIDFGFDQESQLEKDEGAQEQRAKIMNAMSTLSARQREVIYLKYYRGMGYEDIGDAMDINYQSVRNLMYGGLRKLRESGLLHVLTPLIFIL